ncbi:MAG: heavy metal-binding domain-containing protein [Melioribacteraceae bacterium]
MKTLKALSGIAAIMFLVLFSVAAAQEKKDSTNTEHKMMKHDHSKMHEMMKDSAMHSKMMDKNKKKSPLIREGEIDLNAIDKNKDGKVYQDQMDFNVISDKPGECPLCGMNLKEVTLQQAKENLLKHNFKVKNGVEQK